MLLYLRMLRTYTWLDRHRQQRTNMFVSKTETVVGYLFANFLAHRRGDFVDLLYNSSASGSEKCYWRQYNIVVVVLVATRGIGAVVVS